MSEMLRLGIISWRRAKQFSARAHQIMLVDGEPTGLWIHACPHYTALRPYEIVQPNGEAFPEKYFLLEKAKAEAIRLRAETLPTAENTGGGPCRASACVNTAIVRAPTSP
jgi:hypothetical protein